MSEPTADSETTRSERHRGAPDNWPVPVVIGLVIIAVGVVFLARRYGIYLPLPERWWAITILIPAGAALVSAVRFFRIDGGMSARVSGAATAGVLFLITSLVLFLDLEWDDAWPVMVIVVGLGLVARGYFRRR